LRRPARISHDKPGPNAHAAGRNEEPMLKNFEEFQKLGKDNVDTCLKQFGTVSKGWQAIATEFADYSKKSFEEGTAALEKLLGAKTLEKAIEVQSEYAKSAYEGFVAQATKMGELYTDLAKESYKPLEGMMAKVTPAK
jgi:phasin family protein